MSCSMCAQRDFREVGLSHQAGSVVLFQCSTNSVAWCMQTLEKVYFGSCLFVKAVTNRVCANADRTVRSTECQEAVG